MEGIQLFPKILQKAGGGAWSVSERFHLDTSCLDNAFRATPGGRPFVGGPLLQATVLAVTASFLSMGLVPGVTPDAGDDDRPFWNKTIYENALEHANEWIPSVTAPEGLDVVEANQWWRQEANILGNSPEGWVQWVKETYALREDASQAPSLERADLVADVLRIYDLVGLDVSAADLLAIEASAQDLNPLLVAPFANVVRTVADVYEEQKPLADELVAGFPHEVDPHQPYLSPGDRDLMAARAATIVDAVNAFQTQTSWVWGLLPQPQPLNAGGSDPPLFSDPEGLVVLGGLGDATYTRSGTVSDAVLILEPAGNDLYLNGAGGADPTGFWNSNTVVGTGNELVVSVNADLQGNDEYNYTGAPNVVQGSAGIGGIGILLDGTGDDVYYAKLVRNGAVNIGANIQFYFDAGAQGYGFGGYGLLLDGLGNDRYTFEIFSQSGHVQTGFAQGFGALGGLGIHWDAVGVDWWISNGLGINPGPGFFSGMYNQGVGFWSGVGLMIDTGLGNDFYHNYHAGRTVDYYAQAFGAFGGLGVMYEDGGNDDYIAIEEATSSFPGINPLLNCAFGTGSLAGFGVLIDLLGDDSYYGETISARQAFTMNEGFGGVGFAVGVHFDGGGDDNREMYATGQPGSSVRGRGVANPGQILDNVFLGPGGNWVGLFVDGGGNDNYVGPGENDNVWPTGADLPLP